MGALGPGYVQIKELKPGMKNINAVFIVLEVGAPTLTKEARSVRTLRVGDASACVNLSVWDAPGALLQPGDIVRLTRGYAQPWRQALTLYAGKGGDMQKIGEFCMLFNEQVNMSEPQAMPAPQPPAPAPAPAPAPSPSERTNGARAPPSASSGGSAPKQERYPGAGEGAGGGGGDGKNQHKTYVRGRAHQRGGARR